MGYLNLVNSRSREQNSTVTVREREKEMGVCWPIEFHLYNISSKHLLYNIVVIPNNLVFALKSLRGDGHGDPRIQEAEARR